MTTPGGRVALGCAIVLWTSSLAAQTRGRVHDSESLAGVAGAWVAWFETVDSAGPRTVGANGGLGSRLSPTKAVRFGLQNPGVPAACSGSGRPDTTRAP